MAFVDNDARPVDLAKGGHAGGEDGARAGEAAGAAEVAAHAALKEWHAV